MKTSLLRSAFTFLVFVAGVVLRAADAPLPDGVYAEIGTPRGPIVCELYYQKTPLTVASFAGLAEGKLGPTHPAPFFDGLTFHRVVPGFVVQGGDPLGNGEGGPGYHFGDELVPGLRLDRVGVLAMANEGPDTNGSQFFLTLAPVKRLDYLHTVFGQTVRGADVLPQIKQGDKFTVKILRRGAAAEAFADDDAAIKTLSAKTKSYAGPAEAGPDSPFDDPDKLLPETPPRARNFSYKLANFERVTGVRLAARLYAKTPEGDARQLNTWLRDLATQRGVAQQGALAVYFGDRDEWRIWVGDDSVGAFLGQTGGKELATSPAFRDARQKLVTAARTEGDAAYEQQKKTAPADQPVPPGQRVKLQTDFMLDGLIDRLEPK